MQGRGGRWSGFVEAARGLLGQHRRGLVPVGREGEPQSQFITLQERFTGDAPAVGFGAQMSVYLADPMARSAVDFLAEQVAGPGFYLTASDEEARSVVDEFCARVNMDGMLLDTAREVVGLGNCFWERTREGVRIIPILSIERILRTPQGAVQGFKQLQAYGGRPWGPTR